MHAAQKAAKTIASIPTRVEDVLAESRRTVAPAFMGVWDVTKGQPVLISFSRKAR